MLGLLSEGSLKSFHSFPRLKEGRLEGQKGQKGQNRVLEELFLQLTGPRQFASLALGQQVGVQEVPGMRERPCEAVQGTRRSSRDH